MENDGLIILNSALPLGKINNQLGEVHYFQKSTGQEIDFVLNREIAMDVKETPSVQDLNKLTSRAKSLHLSSHLLIGRYPHASNFADFIWGGSIG